MDEYLQFAKNLAGQAGEIMLKHFQVGVASRAKAEAGDTPVTIADTQINRLVVEAVRDAYPTHAVMGEEESRLLEDADYTWVCDPIDGTIPYTMGIPINVFSLALVDHEGEPVVAVVNDPYMKRLYHAVKGQGAYMNGEAIHVNRVSELSQGYVGSSGVSSKFVRRGDVENELFGRAYRILHLQCTVYEAMLVATGQAAATLYASSYAHDVAAAGLIVSEAGGRITDVFGEPQRYDRGVRGSIISNGAVHGELVTIAKRHQVLPA